MLGLYAIGLYSLQEIGLLYELTGQNERSKQENARYHILKTIHLLDRTPSSRRKKRESFKMPYHRPITASAYRAT